MRIEAARYANPLTFLPGNIPISAHIDRLLQRDAGFHACYVDLNQFKPFNDQYGYWQGDEVLVRGDGAGRRTRSATFSGVGGDDFLVLFQRADWRAPPTRSPASTKARSSSTGRPAGGRAAARTATATRRSSAS